jgi:hypothetical protein
MVVVVVVMLLRMRMTMTMTIKGRRWRRKTREMTLGTAHVNNADRWC